MQDGQNLFDHEMSFAGEWGVDETMERIAHEGVEAIVVGIPNIGSTRTAEYSPTATTGWAAATATPTCAS